MPTDSTRDTVAKAFAEAAPEAVEPASDAAALADTAAPIDVAPAADGPARDAGGRFAKPPEGKPGAAVRGTPPARPSSSGTQADAEDATASPPQAASAASPASVLPELKPPADWRAAAREKWGALPREAQEESIRLHVETKKALQELADARRTAQEWQGAMTGLDHIFQGQPAPQVVAGIMRTVAQLHTAPLPARAQILGNLIRTYLGSDDAALRLLGPAIDGAGPAQPAQQQQAPPLGPQDLDAWYEQRRQREATTAAVNTWKEFETANQEFLNEPGFRQRLAVELQIAMEAKGGATPTREDIQAAYNAACGAHPSVAKVMNQRKEVEAAAKAINASTQSSAAAASVKNEPAGPNGAGKAKTTRDEVAKQWDRSERSRV